MASQLNKALLNMSLEEEEEPFVLPDNPEYYSTGRNSLSLVGRILNPQCQSMSDVILDMPRKWKLYDRVKGVAISKERFQFIFKHEHDLQDVLDRGVHTSNLWPLALERWVERPPADYLQYLYIWVRMRNVPINHRSVKALFTWAGFAGEVMEVAYDPEKPQVKDYIRAYIKFDVSKPLRRSRKVTLPGGEEVNILYDYERIQKRCYTCQRLTHEQSHCPFFMKEQGVTEKIATSSAESILSVRMEIADENDPLFGVIPESHLGLDPLSGKPKIAKEVLEGMRAYLAVPEGPEKIARMERVRKSIEDLGNDPIGQKTMLMLEPAPTITTNLDKGKGFVFNFSQQKETGYKPEKLMASAIDAGNRVLQSGKMVTSKPKLKVQSGSSQPEFLVEGSTGYSAGFFETSTSGTAPKKPKARRRPGTYTRKANGKGSGKGDSGSGKKVGRGEVTKIKRKADDDVEPSQSSARFKKPLVVPNEGPSNI
ncbi:uncharacterized protein LOC125608716 [Brassica napus]|uniref:uncharacterized protein LOC125608716 n=1 Tax=Brassica napus TaxID=3708 RepID=UPI002078A023|nr:uncharacterized protein LOC125608716 [Brassica napus]